jgi:predicted O-methyltransferase YrrM
MIRGMAIGESVAPDSRLAGAAWRTLMAAALPGLARRSDRSSRVVARALRDTALGRIPPEEHDWLTRIEARRSELPAQLTDARESQDHHGRHLEETTRAVRWMSIPPVWGRFLMRLVRELAPRSSLELGTGFGLSTAYQAAALELNRGGRLASLDQEALTRIAGGSLDGLGLSGRVELVGGWIERTLEPALTRAEPIDYAFLDADHTEEGTLSAFDAILPHMSAGAVMVLDDINWTDEMRRAWAMVAQRERVSAAIGLRRFGITVVAGGP